MKMEIYMASPKVETWKKKAKTAIEGLGKEFESIAKELAEFEQDVVKKRKAIQDRLTKSAEDDTKKIKFDGFEESDFEDVRKADEELRKTAKDKGTALKDFAFVDPSAMITKSSIVIYFGIQWKKKSS